MNIIRPGTDFCTKGEECNSLSLSEEAPRYGEETNFWAYIQPLENVGSFKYLGRLLMATDDD